VFCKAPTSTRNPSPVICTISNYASFDGLSIFHYDHKRNQTSIRKIRKFQFSTSLVKDEMVWQADVFEMRAK
jgi:hypothetical protein